MRPSALPPRWGECGENFGPNPVGSLARDQNPSPWDLKGIVQGIVHAPGPTRSRRGGRADVVSHLPNPSSPTLPLLLPSTPMAMPRGVSLVRQDLLVSFEFFNKNLRTSLQSAGWPTYAVKRIGYHGFLKKLQPNL